MKLVVGHASDLHACYDPLTKYEGKLPDLWVLSGDLLGNYSHDRAEDAALQRIWFEKHAPELVEVFYGRDVLIIDGNHDRINICPILQQAGAMAHQVALDKKSITIKGINITYAGFREIPAMSLSGRWEGEVQDKAELAALVDKVVGEDPDLLITHCAPGGILDGGFGIPSLTSRIMYSPNHIRAHCFGHSHEGFGQVEHNGVLFSNAACGLRVFEID